VITYRLEEPGDASGIHLLHETAFGGSTEASLVDRLRRTCSDTVSLVAEEGTVLGHILFSPVIVGDPTHPVAGMGLAPMAVSPARQRRGVGAELIRRGIELLRRRGVPLVCVVGHPEYYPRFGFEPASSHGLRSQWEGIPDEAFMVLVLDPQRTAGVSGVVRYRPEFDDLG